jgi:hypothetical protein
MFERFRKSSAPADEPGGVAVRDREPPADDDATTVHDDEARRPPAEDTATARDAEARRPGAEDTATARDAEARRPPAEDTATARDAEARRPPAEDTATARNDETDRPAAEETATERETGRERAATTTDDDRTRVRRDEDERPSGARRAGTAAAAGAAAERERESRMAPVVGDDTLAAMHERQRDRFGGTQWGSAFFGLLSAIGLASILLAVVAAAGVALGLSEVKDTANGTNDTIGLGGGIVLLCVLAVAWYCGGYVAGRMARFDGMRQGLGVWYWTVLLAAAVAILGAIGGQDYNVLAQLNLPNVAVSGASFTTGGIIAGLCALVVTLLFAVLGGKAGDMFHRRVDRVAAREYEPAI